MSTAKMVVILLALERRTEVPFVQLVESVHLERVTKLMDATL